MSGGATQISDPEWAHLGDGVGIAANEPTKTILTHPEGSFLALVHDKSEQNLAALIDMKTNCHGEHSEAHAHALPARLDTILPEIREKIWRLLSFPHRAQLRATCKQFQEEIDNNIGIELYFTDEVENSLRLALTTDVERLVILTMEMSTLGTLIPKNPSRLRELRVQGPISPDTMHEILRRCSHIECLEILHKNKGESTTGDQSVSLSQWYAGKLFLESDQIRYVYGLFLTLRQLKFKARDSDPPQKKFLFRNGLLPLLECIVSPHLVKVDIRMSVTHEESKVMTQALFELFLRCRALKQLRLHHRRTDSYTFEPIRSVDQDRRASPYILKFGDSHPFPQFEILDLEMPERLYGYFDWITLLQSQQGLRNFFWDVGGNYFGYPIHAIKESAKTMEKLTLKTLRCYSSVSDEVAEVPEFLSMDLFHEFTCLKQFHLIGMELSTSRFSRMDMLPKTLQCLQIECFQVLPEHLVTIHRTLPSLKLFSLSHWNEGRHNFMGSLSVILDMINGHRGKYKGLHFLEKSMYSSIEELNEINSFVDRIKRTCAANDLQVDKVSGDNGISFILIIGDQQGLSPSP